MSTISEKFDYVIVRTKYTDEREISRWKKRGSHYIFEISTFDKVLWNNYKVYDKDKDFLTAFRFHNPRLFFRPCYIMCGHNEDNLHHILKHIIICDKTVRFDTGLYMNRYTIMGKRILFIDASDDVEW